MIKAYYALTKPGIIYGNALTTIGGFVLAAKLHLDLWLLFGALIGISLVIASGCVFNNYIDRGIDGKMERTKNRSLVTNSIPARHALIFGTFLGLAGFTILYLYTNFLATIVALVGFFVYVVVYSYFKRHSVFGTIVGSVAGAVPPIVGYVSAKNELDAGALILFLILALWQMPHFYSIAIYRLEDYRTAGIPVMPVKKGILVTKINIVGYIVGFIIALGGLTMQGYTSLIFLTIMGLLGLVWLGLGLKGFAQNNNDKPWARKMFFVSLIVITMLPIAIIIDLVLA